MYLFIYLSIYLNVLYLFIYLFTRLLRNAKCKRKKMSLHDMTLNQKKVKKKKKKWIEIVKIYIWIRGNFIHVNLNKNWNHHGVFLLPYTCLNFCQALWVCSTHEMQHMYWIPARRCVPAAELSSPQSGTDLIFPLLRRQMWTDSRKKQNSSTRFVCYWNAAGF